MKCDHCDKTALVHEVIIRNGQKREVHLCEEHARAAGYAIPSPQPLSALLGHAASPSGAPKATRRTPVCGCCGLAFHHFRQTGLLGCPDCYNAFGELLAPLIEKAQAGAVSHTGKTPRRSGGAIDVQLRRQSLLRELEAAVAAEKYERAAKLRDLLRRVDQASAPGGSCEAPADSRAGARQAGKDAAPEAREG